jgi:integrase
VTHLRKRTLEELQRRKYTQATRLPRVVAYPKDRRRLPTVLSLEKVAQLIDAAGNLMQRALPMTVYGTGMRRTEVSML